MSRARKVKKRLRLVIRQVMILARDFDKSPIEGISRGRFILVEMNRRSPYEEIRQDRHERRVFGHDVSVCDCTADDVWNMVVWNQPASLWMGYRGMDKKRGYDGHAYHKRILHRRKR